MRLVSVWKNKNDVESKDLLSKLLPQADIATLENIGNKPLRSRRKMTYKKWVCTDCKHELFYMVRSCLLCESANVDETTMRAQNRMTFLSN